MDQDQRFLAIGIYINSALYLIGTFTAGFLTHHDLAWQCALLTAALCYFCYYAGVYRKSVLEMVLSHVSMVVGALAGLSLLW